MLRVAFVAQRRERTRPLPSGDSRRATANEANDCGNREQDDRDEEDDLGDLDREARNAAKSEHGCNQRDDQKSQSPTKHDDVPFIERHRPLCRGNVTCAQTFLPVPGSELFGEIGIGSSAESFANTRMPERSWPASGLRNRTAGQQIPVRRMVRTIPAARTAWPRIFSPCWRHGPPISRVIHWHLPWPRPRSSSGP